MKSGRQVVSGMAFLAAVCVAGTVPCVEDPLTRPNFVLMMADDMGMGDTSAYQDFTGNSDTEQIHTPQMDRLARMGVRFTDAHTPSSRCTPTRYSLLTGRYAWRSRMKHFVLFGSQGDPLIEADRPTIATMLRDAGYTTAIVGKWHVGLRYRNAHRQPAAGWEDADLTQALHDTPLDHGFDYAWFTSRSHGSSGVEPGKRNTTDQNVGPGHLHGRNVVSATGKGKRLAEEGENAYVLEKLGSRHSDHALAFLDGHLSDVDTRAKPFFLYYPSNSNHSPYTPDEAIAGRPVAGAARNMAGGAMDVRSDFIYENDVALGRLLDYLADTDDPRREGKKLIDNTIVIFTSDNGAEIDKRFASGPFRSHKGSVYEGGHRVPFLVSWPAGGVGDGDADTPGGSSAVLVGHQDLFATFAEVIGVALPDLRRGEKGAEDSYSVLQAWRGGAGPARPMIYNDHMEAKEHPAAAAIRLDNPVVDGRVYPGQWKLFFDAALLRAGVAHPVELFDLSSDQEESANRLAEEELTALVGFLSHEALMHRTAGGHRLADLARGKRVAFDFRLNPGHADASGMLVVHVGSALHGRRVRATRHSASLPDGTMLEMRIEGHADGRFTASEGGLGILGGQSEQVDGGESLEIEFDRDVIVESVGLVAGAEGKAGGFYQMGGHAPVQVYCVDADIDPNSKDQSGVLSDLGVLKAGETLLLDSGSFLGAEDAGTWRIAELRVRAL